MAHEFAASRRLRKGVLPSAAGSEARATPEGTTSLASAMLAPVVGERVVADVRHEVGNFFHKLYYWADFLAESRAGRPADVTATQMLEETIRGLEELLHATLDLFRPLDASPIRMHAREVADGIVRQLTATLGDRATPTGGTDALSPDGVVLVDPGRLSQLLGLVAQRIASTTEAGALDVRIGASRRGMIDVLALDVVGVARTVVHTTLAEVEWATAENVARLAGGELTVAEAAGRITFGFTVPLRN